MSWKVYDFQCDNCGAIKYDVLVSDDDEVFCDTCTWEKQTHDESGEIVESRAPWPMERLISTNAAPVTIVRGNSDYAERERERLTKRSNDHWQREGKDEAVDRQRMQEKKLDL